MLSKVAERLYWSARYLERVENTARLIQVYDQLLYDLPTHFDLSWYNLIELNGCEPLYLERYKVRNEHNVVKFLLQDDTNPSSILSNLAMIRENVRTTRDALPEEMWELVNEFHISVSTNIRDGINRSVRHEFLTEIISRCQMLNGLLANTMRHDAGWLFMKLGRELERADMTTRIVDAGVTEIIEANGDASVNFQQIVWGNVLRSLSAHTSYRRTVKNSINGPDVLRFLLLDPHFPRSVKASLEQLKSAAVLLPNNERLLTEISHVNIDAHGLQSEQDLKFELRQFLNAIQLQLIDVNQSISETWFTPHN